MMSCAFWKPAGLITLPTDAETLLRKCSGFHLDLGDLLDGLGGEFRGRDIDEARRRRST